MIDESWYFSPKFPVRGVCLCGVRRKRGRKEVCMLLPTTMLMSLLLNGGLLPYHNIATTQMLVGIVFLNRPISPYAALGFCGCEAWCIISVWLARPCLANPSAFRSSHDLSDWQITGLFVAGEACRFWYHCASNTTRFETDRRDTPGVLCNLTQPVHVQPLNSL